MAQVTITAASGPGIQSTNMIINDVHKIDFDFVRLVITITTGAIAGSQIKDYSLLGVTSIVFTPTVGIGYAIAIA